MNENAYAVIMAGGVGSRLWPVSRNRKPKQFHDLLGKGRTLIQDTYDRLADLVPNDHIIVVTNTLYALQVAEQLPHVPESNILTEPLPRNTAPCLAYAAAKIRKRNPNAQVIVTPSDHLIEEDEKFQQNILTALTASKEKPVIVTLGVKPDRPETGFGYIQLVHDKKDKKTLQNTEEVYKVKLFTEKPDVQMAKEFIKSGDFVWNTGIFVTQVRTLNSAFEEYLPDIYEYFEEVTPFLDTAQEIEQITRIYPNCKNVSIDYGIFEKASNVFVIRSVFKWNDLGYWSSIYNRMQKDFFKNYASGSNVMILNSSGNYIQVPDGKLAVIKGIKDMLIIDTGDILLICPRKEDQSVKEIVNVLKEEKNETYI